MSDKSSGKAESNEITGTAANERVNKAAGDQEITRQGTRCQICTGCGRCFGKRGDVTVVTEGGLVNLWQERMRKSSTSAWQRWTERGTQQASSDSKATDRHCDPRWIVAVDIGTTTIAMVLYEDSGRERDRLVCLNPQVKYGADVLSRIQAAQNRGQAEEMRKSVLLVLEEGIRRFAPKWRMAGRGGLVVIAANTTMSYLLMGQETDELGHAPFHASFVEGGRFLLCGVETVLLPGFSAFVGGDILAGMYASQMAEREEMTLFIDLGTNGEMALGNRERILATSTAAGPAFEGDATKGIWGADMVSLTARLLREGLADETGLLKDPYFQEGIRIGNVEITQQNIRRLQLAKGAIAAGMQVLAGYAGLTDLSGISRVVLAGGFGYYLKAQDAVQIGLLPRVLLESTVSAGNTALAGALRYGWERGKEDTASVQEEAMRKRSGLGVDERLAEIKRVTEVINLAQMPDFQDIFLDRMNFTEM